MILFFVLSLIQVIIYSICIDYTSLGTWCEDAYQTSEFLAAIELYWLILGLDLGKCVDEEYILFITDLWRILLVIRTRQYLVANCMDQHPKLPNILKLKYHKLITADCLDILHRTYGTTAEKYRLYIFLYGLFYAVDEEICFTTICTTENL